MADARTAMAAAIRRRRAAVVAGALAVLAVLAFAVRSCGDSEPQPPPSEAARVVPAGVLAYVHLSTDPERPGVERALRLASRFPSFPRVRESALRRLSGVGPGISFQRDVRPWLGDEAALALLDTAGQTAGSLVVVEVTDRRRAQSFLTRAAGPPARTSYRGTAIFTYGEAAAAFTRGFLLIGPVPSLRAAIDAGAGRAPSLARARVYARATEDLPRGRVLDAFASPDGVRRVLAAQPGVLGAAGALLDNPALQGTALALTPGERGAQLFVRNVLDPRLARRLERERKPFDPQLIDSVPEDVLAYLGLTRLDRAAGRLLTAGLAGGGAGRRITQLLQRTQRDLARRAGLNLQRDVLPLFRGEVALWLAPAIPAPVLTLISATDDEDATREAFARLQQPLARLLGARDAGTVPVFEERDVAGVPAFQLRLGPGVELSYAVFDGKLVVSTSLDGIRAVRERKTSLADNDSFRAALGDRPREVTSLVFLDFSELLRLGERTGLSDSRAYLAVRDDLRRVNAVGASASGDEDESTTEISIEIP